MVGGDVPLNLSELVVDLFAPLVVVFLALAGTLGLIELDLAALVRSRQFLLIFHKMGIELGHTLLVLHPRRLPLLYFSL